MSYVIVELYQGIESCVLECDSIEKKKKIVEKKKRENRK